MYRFKQARPFRAFYHGDLHIETWPYQPHFGKHMKPAAELSGPNSMCVAVLESFFAREVRWWPKYAKIPLASSETPAKVMIQPPICESQKMMFSDPYIYTLYIYPQSETYFDFGCNSIIWLAVQ